MVFKYYVSFFQQNLGSFIEMTNIFGMGSVGLESPSSNLPSMMTMVGAWPSYSWDIATVCV